MNWSRVLEAGELYQPFVRRSLQSLDKDRVLIKQVTCINCGKLKKYCDCPVKDRVNTLFEHEFRLAVIEEMRTEKARELALGLKPDYPDVKLKELVEICEEYLLEMKWPKEYLVKRELTKRRKQFKAERGY